MRHRFRSGFMLSIWALTGLIAMTAGHAHAQGLQQDRMLHPGDAFTAETLQQGEMIYHQAVASLPLPSWAMLGLTDWLTMNIDMVAVLGGLVIEPHYPIPSLNLRFRLRESGPGRTGFAFETMYHHMWKTFDDQLAEKNTVRLVRDGTTAFARLTMTHPFTRTLRLHLSAGVSYAESFTIENRNRDVLIGRSFEDAWNPDASLGIDWRLTPWLSLHLNASYGVTFVYVDLVPRKFQIAYAIRVAPFYRFKTAFLRNLRIEGTAFFQYYRDAREWISLALPIFPVFYWQWVW